MLAKRLEREIDILGRHLTVLKAVVREEPIGILKLAEEVKLPKHKVRYSLRVLEHEGLIEPSSRGAITTKKATKFITQFESKMGQLEKKLADISKTLR